MKTARKVLIIALCAVLLVSISVMGTMAYLTSQDSVENTFTVGKIQLGDESHSGLDEAEVDEYGKVISDKRVQANKYKLVPGNTYVKDPTVHVAANSEDAWVFVKVENGISAYEAATVEGGYQNIEAQILANGWTKLADNVYYKYYTQSENVEDLIVFGEFKVADDADKTDGWDSVTAESTKVNVYAYAVQAAGFDTAAEAWGETFGK